MQVLTSDESRPSKGITALLIALALVPYFLNLGTPPLWDANEPLYAQPPKEVLEWEEGDFLAPTWNGRPYFAHPPLSTWITVPFYAVLGSNEFAQRLPMALAAALTILATFRLGCSLGGRRMGLWAAIVLAATPKFWLFSRQLSGDVYMVALLTWAFALAVPSVGGEVSRSRLRWANVLVGLGWLAKGPVILVIYGGALLFAWLLGRPRGGWAELRPWRSLAFVILLGCPWFVYMAIRYQDLGFLGQHFGHYTFGRMLGAIGDRSWFFYLRVMAGDAQPWITILPICAWFAWRARDRRVIALLPWTTILWTVFFFMLSAGKRNVYLMPIYPLMAVAMAPLLERIWHATHRAGMRVAGIGAFVGCVGGALMLYLLAGNEPRLEPEIWIPTGMLAAFAIPFLIAGWRGRGRWIAAGGLALLLCTQSAVALSFPALARFRPVPAFAARVAADQDPVKPEPVIIYRVAIHSMNFYLGRATSVARSAEELLEHMGERRVAFVLVPEHRYDAPAKQLGAPRTGLKNELRGATIEELDRRPVLTFRFDRSILGRGPTTRDLLLLRITRTE
ncbi:MAG: glycosyltransferase family 39 protein [Planctomycetota bacterium]|nr:glycosyltransferase family 39 protein [Planctomycetota bacterium]